MQTEIELKEIQKTFLFQKNSHNFVSEPKTSKILHQKTPFARVVLN